MAVHVANETYLTLHDPRHNLLSIADSTGTVATGDTLRYEPFGTPSVGVTASGIEPRFGGMRYLPGTQLYLSDTRLMDPRHGAWLSPDPLGYVDSSNLYAYARQNPIDYIDPSGLGTEKGKTGGNSDGGDIFDWLKGAKETLTEGIEGLLEATEDSFNFYKGLVTSDEFVGFWQGFGKRSLEIAGVGMFSMGVRTPWTTQMYVREGQQSWEGMKAGSELFTTAWDASWGDESAELRRQEMVGSIVNNFATMSPEEWGSMGPDLLLGVGTGGVGAEVAFGRGVLSTAGRLGEKAAALGLRATRRSLRAGRAPIVADANLIVRAQAGHTGALAEIRAGTTYVTSSQYNEVTNVLTRSQRIARNDFIDAEGIKIINGPEAGVMAQSSEFQDVFNMVVGSHGRADASLLGFSRATGFEAVTMEKRLYNYVNYTLKRPDILVRRVSP